MNLNPIHYLRNTITPLDRWHVGNGFKNNGKIKVGWCGVFPPYQNGGAAVSYYIVKELLKRDDIEIGVIPINNKIEKRLFKGAVFCDIDDSELDVIIFCCLGHEFNTYAARTKAKKIAWQTIHYDPLVKAEETQFKEVEEADLKLFMTQWAQKQYTQFSKQGKSSYVPFGVDTTYFAPKGVNDLKNNENTKPFKITFVSRAHYKKGVMPFLDAIPYVVEKFPDCTFHLHSPLDTFSPYFDEVQQKIREMKKKYPDNLFFTMSWLPYNQIKEVYDNSSILVFPSNNEGFGIPIIEAMSCGVPCIVSDVPPLNELVKPSVGFCLQHKTMEEYHNIPFPDPKEIAEKIIFLRENKKKFEEMKEKCRQRVINEYEIKRSVDMLVDAIKKLIH